MRQRLRKRPVGKHGQDSCPQNMARQRFTAICEPLTAMGKYKQECVRCMWVWQLSGPLHRSSSTRLEQPAHCRLSTSLRPGSRPLCPAPYLHPSGPCCTHLVLVHPPDACRTCWHRSGVWPQGPTPLAGQGCHPHQHLEQVVCQQQLTQVRSNASKLLAVATGRCRGPFLRIWLLQIKAPRESCCKCCPCPCPCPCSCMPSTA